MEGIRDGWTVRASIVVWIDQENRHSTKWKCKIQRPVVEVISKKDCGHGLDQVFVFGIESQCTMLYSNARRHLRIEGARGIEVPNKPIVRAVTLTYQKSTSFASHAIGIHRA